MKGERLSQARFLSRKIKVQIPCFKNQMGFPGGAVAENPLTRVRALVREDPTYPCATTTEPALQSP